MKKIFEEAILEVITFETTDIVTASTEIDPFSLQSDMTSVFGSDKSWSDKSWSNK